MSVSMRDDTAVLAATLVDSLGVETTKALVREALEKTNIERARRDPNAFVEFVGTDQHGDKIQQQPFHEEIQRFIPIAKQGGSRWRGLICLPRDHGKSTQVAYRLVWELGFNPRIRIKIVSATPTHAGKVLGQVGSLIANDRNVQKVFPGLTPGKPWSGSALRVSGAGLGEKEFSVEALSITTAAAGGRADLIMFDDVCNYENAVAKPAVRDKIIETFGETWINLLEPDGRAVYIFTPWSPSDLSAVLSSNPAWEQLRRPAITERGKKRHYLWPSKWGPAELEDRRQEIGDIQFARQFLLRPIADDEIIFTDTVLKASVANHYGFKTPEYEKFVAPMPKVMGVDLGASMGIKSSFTVMMTVGIGPDGRAWLVDLQHGRIRPHDAYEMILTLFKLYNHAMIVVENNAYQTALIDFLQNSPDPAGLRCPVVGWTTTGGKKVSEQIGIPNLSVVMNNGGWGIPTGHLDQGRFNPQEPSCLIAWPTFEVNRDPVSIFLREMVEYPMAAYDDTLMAAWLTNWAAGLAPAASKIESSGAIVV